MMRREDVEALLEVPFPEGVEATWLTTSDGYELRFHQTRIYAIAVTPETTEEEMQTRIAQALEHFT